MPQRNVLQRLASIGLYPELDDSVNGRQRIINIFTWVCIVFCLPYWITMLVFKEYGVAILFFGIQIALFIALWSAHKKKYLTNKIIILLTTNYAVFCLHLFYGCASGFYLYYYTTPLIVFSFFPFNEKWKITWFLSLYILSYALTEVGDIIGFISLYTISELMLDILYYTNVLMSFFFTGFLAFSFSKFHYTTFQQVKTKNYELEQNKRMMENLLNENTTLLSETHHRVKNNLAVISGLFDLQMMHDSNSKLKTILTSSKNRIKSMSLVHESLYNQSNLSQIEFSTYIESLVKEIQNSMESIQKIQITVDVEDIYFDLSKAIPCGLIINEVLTNCFKHAFSETTDPKIYIRMSNGENYNLIISDNGKGFDIDDSPDKNSLGQSLIYALSNQLEGECSFENKNGSTFKLTFS